MKLEEWARILAPLFGQPLIARLMVAAVVGAILAMSLTEVLRAAFYHPAASHTSSPAAAIGSVQPHLSSAPETAHPTGSVGSVTSKDQKGGVTAGNIGTVNQGVPDGN